MFHNMKISHNKYSWANFIRMFFFFYILFGSWILIRKHLSSEMVGALMTRSWAFTRQNLLFSARTVTSTNQILSLHAWNLTNILASFFCVRSVKLLYSDTGVSFLSKSNKKKFLFLEPIIFAIPSKFNWVTTSLKLTFLLERCIM